MKILITGAHGFIGKNLVETLKTSTDHTLYLYTKDHTLDELKRYLNEADFIFHLAGANRPVYEQDFTEVNVTLTQFMIRHLIELNQTTPIVFTSSSQANNDTPYGQSKKQAEAVLYHYESTQKAKVYVYRLPNVFGKWSKPNYNSAIATFCHNIARGYPIQVNESNPTLDLVYIDDVVDEFCQALQDNPHRHQNTVRIPIVYRQSLHEIVNLIEGFKAARSNLHIPDMQDSFIRKLYSTYTSFTPIADLRYDLIQHSDYRGSFTEFVKSLAGGQVSVNISKPGIVKGNHWHHSKNEKFFVVQGEGLIRFRRVGSNEITEYRVSGDHHQVIDIPVGTTHNIENTGTVDMITLMWVNEPFDPDRPDTHPLEVTPCSD